MVSVYMFEKIRELKESGKSQAAIAKELGLDPKTVGKYVKLNSPPRYKARTGSTRIDAFTGLEDKVRSWILQTPKLSDREIYELLLPEGYRGSERTVNRRLKEIRGPKKQERFFDQEYEPGEQSQFDFKEKVTLPFVDGLRVVHLHYGTLPFSNTCRMRAYPFKNYECFIHGVHEFFSQIGGVTKNIRFDNLSPVVKSVLKGSERLYTDDFLKAVKYYGFGLLPCAPGKGNEKGDVERDIRSYSQRILNRVSHEALVFKDFDHLNFWLVDFMRARESELVQSQFVFERGFLRTLADADESVLCKVRVIPVTGHGVIRVGESCYSVPDIWIRQECEVVIGAYTVTIRAMGVRSTPVCHPRQVDGCHSLSLEHILPSLVRKPHAMVRWAHRSILFPHPVCQRFYNYLKKLLDYGAEREYLRVMNLVFHVNFAEIFVAMELVLEKRSENPFEDARELLLGERRPENVIDITGHLEMKSINPELSHYDALIPKEGKR